MTSQTMSFIFGAILVAIGILGGGFEVKELKVPHVTFGVRIIAGIAGLIFVGLGSGFGHPVSNQGRHLSPPQPPPR